MYLRISYQAGYRFGFNGQEKDDEITGVTGSHLDFKYRMYDSRIARFFAVDPLTYEYPWWTPYQFAGNTPIMAKDLEGKEPEVAVFPYLIEAKIKNPDASEVELYAIAYSYMGRDIGKFIVRYGTSYESWLQTISGQDMDENEVSGTEVAVSWGIDIVSSVPVFAWLRFARKGGKFISAVDDIVSKSDDIYKGFSKTMKRHFQELDKYIKLSKEIDMYQKQIDKLRLKKQINYDLDEAVKINEEIRGLKEKINTLTIQKEAAVEEMEKIGKEIKAKQK